MEKYPKEMKLKNQGKVTLRLLEEKDMELLIEFFQSLPLEDRLFLRSDVLKRENILKRFGQLNYQKTFPVIALARQRIIAIGTLFRSEFGWKRNLGEIRAVVAKEYQRQGLCTILVRELFFYALTTNLFKLQAEIMEAQHTARATFERMGFHKEAVLKKQVTDINGKRQNLVIMSLDIEELWFLMEDFIKGKSYVV